MTSKAKFDMEEQKEAVVETYQLLWLVLLLLSAYGIYETPLLPVSPLIKLMIEHRLQKLNEDGFDWIAPPSVLCAPS